MHANDPSIQLVVIFIETMLITFRFSYNSANKLEALGISSLHSHHNLCPKVGKSNTYRILTWYLGSGETAVGSFTGLKLSKRWICQNHIRERDKNEFRIISYLIFPLRTHPKTVFMSRSRPNPTTASLSCTRSGRSFQFTPTVTKQKPTDLLTRRFCSFLLVYSLKSECLKAV